MWTDGRTDKHNETNSRFSQFCERPSKHTQHVWVCVCVGVLVTCGLVFTVFVLFRLCIFILFMLLFNFVSYVL